MEICCVAHTESSIKIYPTNKHFMTIALYLRADEVAVETASF